MSNKYPKRQIHLDFHTSEHIEDVGADFNPIEFARTLKNANVNSVTCFARCHHGWFYYDSKKYPERIHPNLVYKDLLKHQIEYCQQEGIRVPIYTTIQWDYYSVLNHPEWLCVDHEGNCIEAFDCNPGFYQVLCLNTGYREFIFEHIEELLDLTGSIDGFFFDILYPTPCMCDTCIGKMKSLGIDYTDVDSRVSYSKSMLDDFKRELSQFVWNRNKKASIFYNSSHIGFDIKKSVNAYSHLELESLPSGGWGYMHFPVTMRYARNLDKQCIGMTGKFHTYWGDFHSFKNKAALEYECFNMTALNGGVSVGDQLHPRGELCKHTYGLISDIYSRLKNIEVYTNNAKPIVDIGVLTPEEHMNTRDYKLSNSLLGISKMLLELGYQFDIIDSRMDIVKYKLLILPDEIPISKELEHSLSEYLDSGGKLIASYKSGLGSNKFPDIYGVNFKGEPDYITDYLLSKSHILKGLMDTEYVMYRGGLQTTSKGAKPLAARVRPYFNREGEYFCSHQHTPSSREHIDDCVYVHNGVIYLSHPIFKIYNETGALWCRSIIDSCIRELIESTIEHSGPSTLRVSISNQLDEKRLVLHLLHYIPEKRYDNIYTIEEFIPLRDVRVSLNIDINIQKIYNIRNDNVSIAYNQSEGKISFKVDDIRGYEIMAMDYS